MKRIRKLDVSHIFLIVQQVSEQSARSILSFPRVLVVLDIGPAYQEVLLGWWEHEVLSGYPP